MDPNLVGAIGVAVGLGGGLLAAFWRGASVTAAITKAINDSARDLREEIARVSTKVDDLSARTGDVDSKVSYIRGRLDKEPNQP